MPNDPVCRTERVKKHAQPTAEAVPPAYTTEGAPGGGALNMKRLALRWVVGLVAVAIAVAVGFLMELSMDFAPGVGGIAAIAVSGAFIFWAKERGWW